jgi:tetratricopeptide (TPR) repeat protein
MNRRVCLILLCGFTLFIGNAVASESTESLFVKANDLFQTAVNSRGPDRTGKMEQAASLYERIVNEKGIHNGYLYYNLGNCYFHLGRIGKAIVNYRRAESLNPNYADLKRNLKSAQSRRKDNIQKSQARSIARTLLFWHYLLNLRTKIVVFSVLFSMIWIVLLVKLFANKPLIRWGIGLSLFFAMAFGVSAAIEFYAGRSIRFGVILAEQTTPKKGPGESYAESFKEPLHEGTEFRLKDRQGQWMRVELDNGATCWLRARDAELI